MSRYPTPGDVISVVWEDWAYQMQYGYAMVRGTSRHKYSITDAGARQLLDAAFEDHIELASTVNWRSVTAHDVECGGVGDSEVGWWHEDGTGKAWVRVTYLEGI